MCSATQLIVGLKPDWVRKNCYVEESFSADTFFFFSHIFLAHAAIAIKKMHFVETKLYIQVTYSPTSYKDAKNALWSSKKIYFRCLVAIFNFLYER